MSSKVLKVEDLKLGVILVCKKTSYSRKTNFFQITEISPDYEEYRLRNEYPQLCRLTYMVCKIKVIPKTKRERTIVYTKLTTRKTDSSERVEVEKILSDYEFYNPNRKYADDVVDSDSDSESDSDFDSNPYDDYNYDSDLIRKNMKKGSIIVKKTSMKNGKYEFYKMCEESYDEISLMPQNCTKSYHHITGSNKWIIGYKPAPTHYRDSIEVGRHDVVSNYEVYNPNEKYEVELDNAAIYDYEICVDSDHNHNNNPMQNSVKINIQIGQIVVTKPSTEYGKRDRCYCFYRIEDLNDTIVSLSKFEVERHCQTTQGSNRMRLVYNPVPNTINSYHLVTKKVLIADFEAYDINTQYYTDIYNVVFR